MIFNNNKKKNVRIHKICVTLTYYHDTSSFNVPCVQNKKTLSISESATYSAT